MSAEAIKGVGAFVGALAALPAVVLGIEVATLSAATVGALLSLAYSKPEAWGGALQLPEGPIARRALAATARAGSVALALAAMAIVAAWITSIAPHFPGLAWTKEIPKPAMAGVLAFGAQRIVPLAMAWGQRWIDSKVPK